MKRKTVAASEYGKFLDDIKTSIREARISAVHAVNKEMISLYWEMGKSIVAKQRELGRSRSVDEKISRDLIATFSGPVGFSPNNLRRMKLLYLEYKDHPKLARLVREVPWEQNVIIMQEVKDLDARSYYLKATAQMGWTKNVLFNQIKAGAYEDSRAK